MVKKFINTKDTQELPIVNMNFHNVTSVTLLNFVKTEYKQLLQIFSNIFIEDITYLQITNK